MAYARRDGTSDVYLIATGDGKFECVGCSLNDGDGKVLVGHQATMAHMRAHRSAGHCVTKHTIYRLTEEWKDQHPESYRSRRYMEYYR